MSYKPFLSVIIFLVSIAFEWYTTRWGLLLKALVSIYRFFRMGGNIFSTHKTIKNNRFGRGTKLIFQSIQNITRCSRTLWTPYITKQLYFTNSLLLRLLKLLYVICRVQSLTTKLWRLKLQITISTVSLKDTNCSACINTISTVRFVSK